MDMTSLIATGVSTGIVSIPVGAYLGKTWVEHQLRKGQSVWDARIRQQIESYLADQAAQRQYDWVARKRLYEAIGPLRFQLLLACRDWAGRVVAHGTQERYDMNVATYYGRSTLYRLIRPVTIGLLIERQMAYADFAVDPAAVQLLRFSNSVRQCLSGEFLVAGHSQINWDEQEQHVFAEVLSTAAAALVRPAGEQAERVMRFDELRDCLQQHDFVAKVAPFPALLAGFTPASKPLLWVRMIGYARICQQFVAEHGRALGIQGRDVPVKSLLEETRDREISEDLELYVSRCNDVLGLPY
jgi:hypothetical protein